VNAPSAVANPKIREGCPSMTRLQPPALTRAIRQLSVLQLSDVKKEMQDESNRSDKDRDPEAVLGGF
jgi:hypothetical protein